jgi:hypothetical protein
MRFYDVLVNRSVPTEANRGLTSYMKALAKATSRKRPIARPTGSGEPRDAIAAQPAFTSRKGHTIKTPT